MACHGGTLGLSGHRIALLYRPGTNFSVRLKIESPVLDSDRVQKSQPIERGHRPCLLSAAPPRFGVSDINPALPQP